MTRSLDQLSLRLQGQRITAERFLRASEAFFGLLSEVADAFSGKPNAIEWLVTVKAGSIVLGARAAPKATAAVEPAAVVDAAYRGLKALQQRNTERPPYFTDDALQSARDLAKLVDGTMVKVLQFRRSRESFQVREGQAVHNVDVLLGGSLQEWGTIEGRLETISIRGGLHVGVWDALTDRQVRCFIRPDKIDEVKSAFDRRVAVTGMIRCRPTGEAVSIEVDTIEIFPASEDLPTADDVYGILARAG